MVIRGFTTPTCRGEPKGMRVTVGPPLAKSRKMYRFTGMQANLRYGVHDHSLGNVRRGLVERVFMVEKSGKLVPTPKPTPGSFESQVRFRDALVKLMPKTTRLTPAQFCGFYKGRKLKRYQEAAESLEVRSIVESDAWLSTFVKAEKLNLTAKPDPAPRVIQPRDPRYNVEVGRYLRHAEEILFSGIDTLFGGRTIFKGINADTAGKEMADLWFSFKDPVGIGMDASRFDQHVSVDALEFEHSMWLQMFPISERAELKKLLSWQLRNKGLARCPDGSVRYMVDGCRMSGDMNTSSGNCFIMCSSVWTWCMDKKISHFRLANNGDDCMLVVERSDEKKVLNGLVEYYTNLGFTMKIEKPVYELEHVEFCQTRPVYIGKGYRMIRNLHQSLSKDLHCVNDLSSQSCVEAWVDAVGTGGRIVNEGVPVMARFFEQFPSFQAKVHLREHFNEQFHYRFHRYGTYHASEPTPETRYSFWRAFGILPDEQIALEASFTPLNLDPAMGPYDEGTSLLHFSRA